MYICLHVSSFLCLCVYVHVHVNDTYVFMGDKCLCRPNEDIDGLLLSFIYVHVVEAVGPQCMFSDGKDLLQIMAKKEVRYIFQSL